MKPFAPLALALCLTTSSLAQTPQFTDPANLRGERPRAHDGRELPIDLGAPGLQQLLRKLNTRASILNIVAHPDDEDGGMLTLYSRGLGARVADISLTRGEGGQNAMTADFEDALGLLRTQELLANDRYTGVDQMFGTEADFGFSKTKEEAFAKWTHERVLYDVVRAIRIYRPLVLTSTWIGGVTDGHGQHQVSGEIAQEAFKAAGDPNVFPELTREGILPWQPLRVYARVPMQSITPKGLFDYATGQYTPARFTNYVTGEVSTTPPSADVIVHEGTPDPLLTVAAAKPSDLSPARAAQTIPLSYVQFARIGLGLQKSQVGPGVRNAPSGTFDVAFHLYGSAVLVPTQTLSSRPEAAHFAAVAGRPAALPAPTTSSALSSLEPNFFTGIDTSILSIQDLAPDAFPSGMLADIARGIKSATDQFDPARPEKIAPALAASLKVMDELIPEIEKGRADPIAKASALHELRIKRVQLNDALALALDPQFDATTDKANVLKGSPISVHVSVSEKQGSQLVSRIDLRGGKDFPSLEIDRQSQKDSNSSYIAKSDSTDKREQVDASLNLQTGMASTEPYFYRDNIEQPVYDLRDPTLRNAPATPAPLEAWSRYSYNGVPFEVGRVVHAGSQSVSIVPPINVSLSTHAQVLPRSRHTFDITATDHSLSNWPTAVSVCLPDACLPQSSEPTSDPHNGTFRITLPDTPPPSGFTVTTRVTEQNGAKNPKTDVQGYRPIGYGDLPRTNFYTPATTRIVPVDLNLPTRHNIAYLPGTGDAVPEALTSIGLTPTLLTVADLTPANLAKYDTVILGVRTYAAHPDLHGAPTQALLDYAKSGGNVVIQYQTPEFTAADAPFPLSLGSNEKVVDETTPVRLLFEPNDPAERLLVVPNRITPDDFNGWTEERGHGFLSTWDPRYSAPTETHDPGQDPQRGGLITTQLGDDPKHHGRWTYVAFALYRQLPEAVPGAFRLFINLLNP